jgi:hypothetical protein
MWAFLGSFSANTLQKQTFTKTHVIMSVNPLYLSGNYCLVFFHAMLMVKNDTYLPSTDVGPVESCFGPFGDNVSVGAR